MSRFCSDAELIETHYPWVAFAVLRSREVVSNSDKDQKPAEFARMLDSIMRTSRKLEEQLAALERAVFAAPDNVPKVQQFARTYQLMLQRFSGEDEGEAVRMKFTQWLLDLHALGWASREASLSLAPPHWQSGRQPASGGSGPRLRGLGVLVGILSRVWLGMTGRTPTARRSFKRSGTDEGSDDPDFVQFVIAVAKAAGLRPPTRSAVRTALKAF